MKQRFGRNLILVLIALLTILFVAWSSKPADKDFISFWSAGRLLAQHLNPYDQNLVLSVERSQGAHFAKALIMRNPPWALPLMFCLGHLSARIGLLAWMSATIASVLLCFRVYPTPQKNRILVFLFAPVYACLASGQSSAFLLLGFALFLVLRKRFPYLSGTSLVLMAIKPHLFVIFFVVMLLDLVLKREMRVLAGAAAAFLAACAWATWFDPRIWMEYGAMLKDSSLSSEFLQTPAYLLRFLIAPRQIWVQLLPTGLGLIWGVHYYLKRRETWDLRVHAIPVLFVSLLTSPYAWFTDEIMLLPALLYALSSKRRAPHSNSLFLLINTSALALLLAQVQLSSGAYLWTSSAWTALYFYDQRAAFANAECGLAELQEAACLEGAMQSAP